MATKQQIENRVKTFSDKVQKNITISTPKDLGVDSLLHLSVNNRLGKLSPFISTRQADSEDRSVARICTAPTILGCIIGYYSTLYNFHYPKENEKYKGGWVIYSIPFDFAVTPNNKLVYDATSSGEQWLITYSEDTIYYTPKKAAKLFISSVTYEAAEGKPPTSEYTFYLEIIADSLAYNSKRSLDKGYYKITGPTDLHSKNFNNDKDFSIKSVTKEVYEEAKLRTASMLSLEQSSIIARW